ncbi:forkhead domain-containing protein [Drepanopeziza brunnea f. sp. 'multigermtubi' MB_m1]|uniref:Forkhead domain-containing protein n=2 Tax=Drepanopeziza brunnea f. sp. 'multigermtubi' TaxID=698441 RepID=K1WZQ9_MARBU|nr:forkhead domain-containing protein [Drepanopeziza brunnea f. sp. 'multigermtubi' MB_m1]EKD18127.1 forkhead domain-containing protein [Drepanopeziza brunnea f. sp. 'multigermtubi' MB_m1]
MNMNTGQYHHRPQMAGLLADEFQYGDYDSDLDTSAQASQSNFSFDGLPRASSQHLMNSPSSSSNILSTYSNLLQPIPMSQTSVSWTDAMQSPGGFQDQNNSFYPGYSASNLPLNGHHGNFSRGPAYQQPRYIPNMYGLSDNDNAMALDESYAAPSAYILDSKRSAMQHSPVMTSPFDNQHMNNARDFQRMSISHSPVPKMEELDESQLDFSSFETAPPFSLPPSETSDEGNTSREMTAADVEDHNDFCEQNPEEPYAKLIHRALMSVPSKSMVLQEIYQWFRDNTQKGGTCSKGWMNSIRHNLSMNAAFKKTERKTPDNDSKKSTEWVLEEFAIRDGVQSTTRYRKGTSSKKSSRNETPSLARVVSGRRGGISTKQAKQQQQQQRQQRAKDDQRRDFSRSSQRGDSMRMRRPQYQQQQHDSPSHIIQSSQQQRQRSPLTPPSAVDFFAPSAAAATTSPYFFGGMKVEQESSPYDDMHQLYRLDDVQGCVEDSPLFSSNGDGGDVHFHTGPSMSSSQQY